jgi:hypothetical protein
LVPVVCSETASAKLAAPSSTESLAALGLLSLKIPRVPATLLERHCLHEENNGDGAVASYLNNVRTTKEIDVVQIVNDAGGADDMRDHDEWISYSHLGHVYTGTKILELAL